MSKREYYQTIKKNPRPSKEIALIIFYRMQYMKWSQKRGKIGKIYATLSFLRYMLYFTPATAIP